MRQAYIRTLILFYVIVASGCNKCAQSLRIPGPLIYPVDSRF